MQNSGIRGFRDCGDNGIFMNRADALRVNKLKNSENHRKYTTTQVCS